MESSLARHSTLVLTGHVRRSRLHAEHGGVFIIFRLKVVENGGRFIDIVTHKINLPESELHRCACAEVRTHSCPRLLSAAMMSS